MKVLIVFTLCFFPAPLWAQKKENVIVKYKQYEKFDLGNLEIKGQIIAPGDLSVGERKRKVFQRDLLDRQDFFQEVHNDINNLR